MSVENLPDVKGYASSDAFVKHPTIEGLYKVYVMLYAGGDSMLMVGIITGLAGWTTS